MANAEQAQAAVAAVAPSPPDESAGSATNAAAAREAWSRSQLPLMRKVVIGLTVFFFLASALQLVYLHVEIVNAPQRDLADVEAMLQKAQGAAANAADHGLPAGWAIWRRPTSGSKTGYGRRSMARTARVEPLQNRATPQLFGRRMRRSASRAGESIGSAT